MGLSWFKETISIWISGFEGTSLLVVIAGLILAIIIAVFLVPGIGIPIAIFAVSVVVSPVLALKFCLEVYLNAIKME